MKKISLLFLRISVTLALLIFLFSKVDFLALFVVIKNSDFEMIAYAFALYALLNFLIFIRWRFLCTGLGIKVGLLRLLASYMTSQFFNLILPSTIGGDAVKTFDIARHTKSHSSGILATVILDRFCGFFGLLTVLTLAVMFGLDIVSDPAVLLVMFILLTAVVVLAAIMFSSRLFNGLFKYFPFQKLKNYLFKVHEATSSYRHKRRYLVWAWLISVGTQAGVAFVYYFLAKAIGLDIKIIYFLIFVPIISAFSVIPISVGGLGVRDTASVFLFTKIGVSATKAFTLSLLNFSAMFIFGVLGGGVYVAMLYRRWLQRS
ncbi:MAG: lysylphosphatidylglycerol synthase transmembrane domain-containing protein [Candidatus Omnitrophota bacterium]